MAIQPQTIDTAQVGTADRVGFWSDSIGRFFGGVASDAYGDAGFDGRMSRQQAGDVVLTRLTADRHRVVRPFPLARRSGAGYLKIVAPYAGCAGVQQQGREAWVAPDQWCIYDTEDPYAVANPVRADHLIVMLPKEGLADRGLALAPLMARPLGGGVARLALATMRSACRELPGMPDAAAPGVGDAITQLVRLAMLDLAGMPTAATQREALRERIKQHVAAHLGDPALSVGAVAEALGCSRRQLYNAFADEPDGVAGHILRRRLEACRLALADAAQCHRSITCIAFAHGFSNMAHFSRVFRARFGMAPGDHRRGAARPDPARGSDGDGDGAKR